MFKSEHALPQPNRPYQPHLTGQTALVTGAMRFVDGGMMPYPGFENSG
jgi:hypothetical protein